MGVNSLPKTVTRQRRGCDLNPDPSAPESSTLITGLPSDSQGGPAMRCLTFVPLITNDDEVHDVSGETVEEDVESADDECSLAAARSHTLLIARTMVSFSAKYQHKHRTDHQYGEYLQIPDQGHLVKTPSD